MLGFQISSSCLVTGEAARSEMEVGRLNPVAKARVEMRVMNEDLRWNRREVAASCILADRGPRTESNTKWEVGCISHDNTRDRVPQMASMLPPTDAGTDACLMLPVRNSRRTPIQPSYVIPHTSWRVKARLGEHVGRTRTRRRTGTGTGTGIGIGIG